MAKLAELLEQLQVLQDTQESLTDEEFREELSRRIEEAEGELEDKLIDLARYRKRLQDEAKEVIGQEVSRLSKRKSGLIKRADSLGELLKFNIQRIGGKVQNGLGTLSIRKNPQRVEIKDHGLIPSEYWSEVATATSGSIFDFAGGTYAAIVQGEEVTLLAVDKRKILDGGEDIPGARITQTQSITFR